MAEVEMFRQLSTSVEGGDRVTPGWWRLELSDASRSTNRAGFISNVLDIKAES